MNIKLFLVVLFVGCINKDASCGDMACCEDMGCPDMPIRTIAPVADMFCMNPPYFGYEVCGVKCIFTYGDPLNCGGCGVLCQPGMSCCAGFCNDEPTCI